ncbi:MAG: hypothetical protein WAZ99_08275 [Rectinemataceae bacterium]
MKKTIIALVIAIALTGAASAQAITGQNFGRGYIASQSAATLEKSTVEGTLELTSGGIAVKQGDNTYYVMGLNRLVGFVDGLKEGAKVKLEGYAFAVGTSKTEFTFHTLTLGIGDRTIDLSQVGSFGMGMGGMAGGRGFGGGQGNISPMGNGRGQMNGRSGNSNGTYGMPGNGMMGGNGWSR